MHVPGVGVGARVKSFFVVSAAGLPQLVLLCRERVLGHPHLVGRWIHPTPVAVAPDGAVLTAEAIRVPPLPFFRRIAEGGRQNPCALHLGGPTPAT